MIVKQIQFCFQTSSKKTMRSFRNFRSFSINYKTKIRSFTTKMSVDDMCAHEVVTKAEKSNPNSVIQVFFFVSNSIFSEILFPDHAILSFLFLIYAFIFKRLLMNLFPMVIEWWIWVNKKVRLSTKCWKKLNRNYYWNWELIVDIQQQDFSRNFFFQK